jgi:hypothetical protein
MQKTGEVRVTGACKSEDKIFAVALFCKVFAVKRVYCLQRDTFAPCILLSLSSAKAAFASSRENSCTSGLSGFLQQASGNQRYLPCNISDAVNFLLHPETFS